MIDSIEKSRILFLDTEPLIRLLQMHPDYYPVVSAVSEALAAQFQASGTIVNAIGGYSREPKQIIYFVVNRFQINRLRTVVYAVDASAYVSVQEVSDIMKAMQ